MNELQKLSCYVQEKQEVSKRIQFFSEFNTDRKINLFILVWDYRQKIKLGQIAIVQLKWYNKMNEYIAYQGKKFTVEWYYNSGGRSQSLNYYRNLSEEQQIRTLSLFKRMGDFGEIKDITRFNYEGDKIYTFKPMPDRFLCFFFERGKIIVTNAFCKKKQKFSPREKDKALKNKQDYERRVIRGDYYE